MSFRHWPLLLLLLLIPGSPLVAADSAVLAEITGDHVRVRAGPGTIHAILLDLSRGDLVVVVGEEGDWKKVRVPGGIPAWVNDSLVRVDSDGTAVVKASRVLLRPTAGKDLLPLETRLDRGDVLTILKRKGKWLEVLAPDRVYGYVYGDFVRAIGPADEAGDRIAKAAKVRRAKLLAGRSDVLEKAAAKKRRRQDRDTVVRLGKEILDGKGNAESLENDLTRIVIGSDDDLTRGYAKSLLALLRLREKAEKLKKEVAKAEAAKDKTAGDLEKRLKEAQSRYDAVLSTVRDLKAKRENPFRGVGRIEKHKGEFVLVKKGHVVYELLSKRFDLSDYVGRRVGVNGRMVGRVQGEPVDHLMVDTIEILKPGSGSK